MRQDFIGAKKRRLTDSLSVEYGKYSRKTKYHQTQLLWAPIQSDYKTSWNPSKNSQGQIHSTGIWWPRQADFSTWHICSQIVLYLNRIIFFRLSWISHIVTWRYESVPTKQAMTDMQYIFVRVKRPDRVLFDTKENEILLLNKPLYGVCNAGDYWGLKISDHVTDDLGMYDTEAYEDSTLFVTSTNNRVISVTELYVDGQLKTKCPELQESVESARIRFRLKSRMYDSFFFFAAQIGTIKDGSFKINPHYHQLRTEH